MDLSNETEWQRLVAAWGPGAEVGGRLGGGPAGDVREVRVDTRLAVGRLSERSRAGLDWELDLLSALRQAGLRVPAIIPTASGSRRADFLVLTEWIPSRAVTPDDARRRARYLGLLHELTEGCGQRPGFRTAHELVSVTAAGDIDLSGLPDGVVTDCRAAWSALPTGPLCVVHGEPEDENCLVSYDGDIVLIDWDGARVDHPWFDLAGLPPEDTGLTERQHRIARRASCAWEVARHWRNNQDYARLRLRELQRVAA